MCRQCQKKSAKIPIFVCFGVWRRPHRHSQVEMLPSHFLYRKGVVHEENRSYVCMTCVNEQPNKTSHKISIYSASKPCWWKVQKWIWRRIWGRAELEESICQIFHMFKHFIMFSPYIWSIMTVTSMFINMLFSSTLNTKDFLAPAHDLGGLKIQQSCSSI